MTNGFSNERMIELILEGQGKIQEDIRSLSSKVDSVMNNGCAHRPDDVRRIKDLESWRTRGIIGVIVTLITSLGALLGMIWQK